MLFSTTDLHKALIKDLGRTNEPNEASTVKHWAAFQLQRNITKKYTDLDITVQAERAATEKFLSVNEQLLLWRPVGEPVVPSYTSSLGYGRYEAYRYQCLIHRIFTRFSDLWSKQFYDGEGLPKLTMAKAFNVGMVGPGASIGATDDNFVDKLFNSRLSCTNPILHKYYLQAICHMKPWRKAEVVRSRTHGPLTVVKGNNLFFVPKETIIARTAATEPTLNMFGQLGYGKLIEGVLKQYHDIDLSIQQNVNRWFAKSGSLSGEYATIDLSSASDTIGLAFVKYYAPVALTKDLELLRSPVSRVPGRRPVVLNMISTMGNGYTFPLQTWIFANLVLATFLELGEPVFDVYGKRRYAVNGDDIICPTAIFNTVTDVLHSAGFTVNKAKSFSTGGFRESCGGDYFRGHPVRAVYLKRCRNDADVYGLINRLLDWSALQDIPLRHTIHYLSSLVPFRPIPQYEDERAGIRTPLARLTRRKTSRNGHYIYHALKQRTVSIKPEDLTVNRLYHAFHVALLHGSFRKGRITPRLREGEETYKVVKLEAPISWDFVLDARLTIEERRNTFELHFPIREM